MGRRKDIGVLSELIEENKENYPVEAGNSVLIGAFFYNDSSTDAITLTVGGVPRTLHPTQGFSYGFSSDATGVLLMHISVAFLGSEHKLIVDKTIRI